MNFILIEKKAMIVIVPSTQDVGQQVHYFFFSIIFNKPGGIGETGDGPMF